MKLLGTIFVTDLNPDDMTYLRAEGFQLLKYITGTFCSKRGPRPVNVYLNESELSVDALAGHTYVLKGVVGYWS